MRALALAIALAVSVPGMAQAQDAARAVAEPAIAAEARAFMADYARDLLAGDRAAIAARYDPQGAWMVRAGQARFVAHARISQLYAGEDWQAPAAFEWRDLVFIPLGDDAVTVIGRFAWTSADQETGIVAYNAQFVRHEGGLRIRVEDETPVAPDAP